MGKERKAGSIVSAAGADRTTAGIINSAGAGAGHASFGGLQYGTIYFPTTPGAQGGKGMALMVKL